ncbi:MAG: acyltransferase [Candidatus Cloacimonadota bacterium]|nr:MAG: acyltransferase [Candidatus Cloacimonadota bacterium]
MINKFTREHTLANKGVALILLLWHHLFGTTAAFGENIKYSAGLAKVCVAIFLILSGYGLNESTQKSVPLLKFYFKRLINIYYKYWIIWILFVPVGVLCFNRSFIAVYGDPFYFKLFINFMGLQKLMAFNGYNPTWWFITLIIGLYVIFPFLKILTMRYRSFFLGGIFILTLLCRHSSRFEIPLIMPWIFPFTVGIFLSQIDGFVIVSKNRFLRGIKILIYPLLLAVLIFLRKYGVFVTGTDMDGILGTVIILTVSELIEMSSILSKILQFTGKHSFNIFLFHTFIYLYYFKNFIYISKNPLIILITLLLICLFISIIMEFILKKIKLNDLLRSFIEIAEKSALAKSVNMKV